MRSRTPSLQARTELRKLGDDISIARRRRRMTQARLAEGAGIDVSTLRKLEHGHPSVSLGTLAMVLLVLGNVGYIAWIATYYRPWSKRFKSGLIKEGTVTFGEPVYWDR